MTTPAPDPDFHDAVRDLVSGAFSKSESLFVAGPGGERPRIVRWHEQGLLDAEPQALAEALTCACFLGRTDVAEYLLAHGVDPAGGIGTGLNALHWAANRGQLEAVRLMLRHNAPLETRSMYDGTALGTAVWSAINEPRGEQLRVIDELLAAGADLSEADYPTGHPEVDAILRKHGAA
jgi:ankyrin repeat protein